MQDNYVHLPLVGTTNLDIDLNIFLFNFKKGRRMENKVGTPSQMNTLTHKAKKQWNHILQLHLVVGRQQAKHVDDDMHALLAKALNYNM